MECISKGGCRGAVSRILLSSLLRAEAALTVQYPMIYHITRAWIWDLDSIKSLAGRASRVPTMDEVLGTAPATQPVWPSSAASCCHQKGKKWLPSVDDTTPRPLGRHIDIIFLVWHFYLSSDGPELLTLSQFSTLTAAGPLLSIRLDKM